jgi:hypothetical protein
VGPNNIFWPYYTDFSTYTARLSTFNLGRTSLAETVILTDGISLDYNTARELYTRQIPFHYLMISQLLHAEMDGACLHVPGQNITLILVPDSLRLTDAARTCLTAFQAAGGRVVFTDAPEWTQCLSAVRVPIRFTNAPDLRISWQKREDAQYVLLVNEGNDCMTSFSLPQEQQLEIMDAWTGTREDRGSVSHGEIRIRALQSLILRFSAPDPRTPGASQVSPIMKTMDISHLLSKPVCSDLSTHTMTYTLTAEGEVIVREQMNTEKNAKVSGLFRYGVQLQMPKGFDRISYYGRGPVENYCDRNSSEFLGVYNSNANDEYFSYVRPQESGNHTDIRWFRVQNAEGLGLEFYSNAPMEASALKFLTEDLDDGLVKDKKIDRHSGDLTERPQTQVHLQQRQMGMGCVNSWGAWPRKEYRLEYKDYDFTFAIKPVHKTEKK